MTARATTRIDPDTGIPDLIRRLTDDSKRLASDEVRLAKLEVHESVHSGIRGSLWLALALAVGVVSLVALTVLLITVVTRLAGRNWWAGALIVGALELAVGWVFVRSGLGALQKPSYTLEHSREAIKDTATWVRRTTAS